jgi:hypothetical protein
MGVKWIVMVSRLGGRLPVKKWNEAWSRCVCVLHA